MKEKQNDREDMIIQTKIGDLKIARITSREDLRAVIEILEEAARWIRSRGINQWAPGGFARDLPKESFEGVFLASLVETGEPVATLRLQWSDRTVWGDMPSDAGYIHRFAVRRKFAGNNIGADLLDCAAKMIADSGKKYIRLDCKSENTKLRRYYLNLGFSFRGERKAPGWNAALFEREV